MEFMCSPVKTKKQPQRRYNNLSKNDKNQLKLSIIFLHLFFI